jgi:O-antigen/teichoic acid export membrane protein
MPRLQGGLLMIERALIFSGLLVLLASDKLNAVSGMFIYAATPLLMVFIGLFYLRKLIFARFSLDKLFIKKMVSFSLPLLPFTLIGYFSGSYFDAMFITNFLSTRDLGIYSVATQINGIALQFPTLANSLLLPLFISLQKESQSQRTFNYFRNVLPSLTLLWGIACAMMAFFGYFVVPLIFGAEFSEAIPALWILLTASAISLPAFLGYFPFSNSASTTYISMFAAIFSAVANITANFWLIPKFGLEGCAWATVIAYFVSISTFALFLRRFMKIPFSWNFIAMLPALGGGLSFSLTENNWLSLCFCLVTSFFIAYWFRGSIHQTLAFLKILRNYKVNLN